MNSKSAEEADDFASREPLQDVASERPRRSLLADEQPGLGRQPQQGGIFAAHIEFHRFPKVDQQLLQRRALGRYRDFEAVSDVLSFAFDYYKSNRNSVNADSGN